MAQNGTLFFNNSFPEFDDEYVGQILSDWAMSTMIWTTLLPSSSCLKAKRWMHIGVITMTTWSMATSMAKLWLSML